jgi:predicted neuraminidase
MAERFLSTAEREPVARADVSVTMRRMRPAHYFASGRIPLARSSRTFYLGLAAALSFLFPATFHAAAETDPGASQDPAEYEQDLVLPKGEFIMNHGSSIAELPDGALLCAWYAGSSECVPDVNIYCSRFDPRRKTWGARSVLAGNGERAEWRILPTKSVGNVALHVDDEGIVWAFYAAVPFGGWTAARVDYRTSKDSGLTWSRPRTLIRMFSNLPRSKPVRVGSGRFAIPLYHNIGRKHAYTCTVTVAGGEIVSRTYEAVPGEKHTQPAILRRADGELFAYLRDPTWKSLMFSRLDPVQRKWSPAERLQVPNPNAAVDVAQTSDGRVLLVYNDSPKDRVPLSLAYSSNGRDFKKIWDFETEPGSAFSYPALIRASDGSYHLTYSYVKRSTIKHVRFSEKWLNEKIAAADNP